MKPVTQTSDPIDTGYEYADLGPALADEAKSAAQRIKKSMETAVKSYFEIGGELVEMKLKLPHGEFGKWIQCEFAMSERSAQNYMNAAKLHQKSPNIEKLSPKAVYTLSAPSTPDIVVDNVIAALTNGNTPSYGTIIEQVAQTKSSKPSKDTQVSVRHQSAIKAIKLLRYRLGDDLPKFTELLKLAGSQFSYELKKLT